MPSPFPGMDPYLEDSAMWSSFHFDLIAKTKDGLLQGLRLSRLSRLGLT